MIPWLTTDGPAIAPADALRRLADEPVLLCLHGGGQGWTHVAWGMAEEPVRAFADLRVPIADAAAPAGDGWSAAPSGWIVQLDYEFPATPGRRWRLDALASWDAAGRCRLRARDQAGLAALRAGLARAPATIDPLRLAAPLVPAWDAAGHAVRVARIRALIAAGDIYQANLTLPVRSRLAPGRQRDLALFLALSAVSPAPYGAFLRSGGRTVVSHSPEAFLSCAGGALASEPIKGTRRRVPGAEAATCAELLASAKDRAELAMIVDLVRNDLGRVARAGSVRVAEAARVMDLPYVHHLVARVEARLRPGLTAADALAAAFPAGSITGAPKLRAMQVIHDSESGPRGAYCGAFGWLGDDGGAELAVAIRTLAVAGDDVRLDAGGGIVADSDPAAELAETELKAAGWLAALDRLARAAGRS
jgi:para-aminobenzoate synthetase component 1